MDRRSSRLITGLGLAAIIVVVAVVFFITSYAS